MIHPTRSALIRGLLMAVVSMLRPQLLRTRHGFDLWIPRSDRSLYTLHLWLSRRYEPEGTALAMAVLKPGDLAVDVGANVGYYSCLYASRVGATGEVHSWEPEPRNRELLRANVERNGFSRVCIHPEALSDAVETRRLHLCGENRGDHTLVDIPGRTSIEVSTTTFDTFARQTIAGRAVRLVKIDVQGCEGHVLAGMRESIQRRQIENIVVEFTPSRVALAGMTPQSVLQMIEGYDLRACILSSTVGRECTDLAHLSSNIDRYTADPYAAFDLHLVPREAG